ncbi:hypothetical protein O6H91_07G000400 [Diphasiastrum complanatum]|uniref:Uncharacterized protein n=1 Tax=Diphasiastrum complanatum TaxID=34168 RepID=A0ACC2D1K8_DIPCM|nr:hypothetical protein O6H91_07G000400 [Diphasiastrum complanatum]
MSSSNSYNAANNDQGSSYSTPMMNVKIMIIAMVILVLVVLVVAAMHLYVRYLWVNHGYMHWEWGWAHRTATQDPERMHAAAAGLDKGVLDALPTFVYTKQSMEESMECSVCISEFQENETGRLLPKCNHCFHTACIDMWFHSHSTCPLCRASVGEEPISHEDFENIPVDEEMGVQTVPSHDVTLEPSCVPNYASVAEEQLGTNGEDLRKNPFGTQGTSSEQQKQQQEHPNSDPHMNLEKVNPSLQYPVNTLFYGNQNYVSSRSSSRAERFKKLEHLVIEVPNRPAICPSNSTPRTTPSSPTPNSVHESRTPLSHRKTIKRILSMREKRSSVPATPKSSTDYFHQAMLTP